MKKLIFSPLDPTRFIKFLSYMPFVSSADLSFKTNNSNILHSNLNILKLKCSDSASPDLNFPICRLALKTGKKISKRKSFFSSRLIFCWVLLSIWFSFGMPELDKNDIGQGQSVCWAAGESWTVFLNALSERGYYDVGLTYLQSMSQRSDCPADLKEQLDFQMGKMNLELVQRSSDVNKKQYSNEARTLFKKFIAEHPEHSLAFEAENNLTRLLVDEGKSLLARIEKSSVQETADGIKTTGTEKKLESSEESKIREEARLLLTEAKESIERSEKQAYDQAKAIQSDEKRKADTEEAGEAYARFLQIKIYKAMLQMEFAKTWKTDAPEFKTEMEKAQKDLHDIFVKYQQFPMALSARFFEAKAYYELKNMNEALNILSELAILPTGSSVSELKTKVLLLLTDIVLEQKSPKLWLESIRQFHLWKTGGLPKRIYDSLEGQKIHLQIGKIYLNIVRWKKSSPKEYDETIKNGFSDKKDPVLKRVQTAVSEAVSCFQYVESLSSSLSFEAQELLLSSELPESARKNQMIMGDIHDFEEGKKEVLRSWNAYVAVNQELLTSSDEKRAGFKDSLDRLAEQTESLIRQTLDFKDKKTSKEEIYALYSQWGILLLNQGRPEEAAVLFDFLTKRCPEYTEASKSAELALKSYRVLFSEDKKRGDNTDFAEKKVADFAAYILERWGQNSVGTLPVVQDATLVQIQMAIESQDLEQVRQLLTAIPENTVYRATADITVGQALWRAYLTQTISETSEKSSDSSQSSQASAATPQNAVENKVENQIVQDSSSNGSEGSQESVSTAPDSKKTVSVSLSSGEKREELLTEARDTLERGVQGKLKGLKAGGSLEAAAVYAALSLAQVYVTLGDYDQAKIWLSEPIIGPFTIVSKSQNLALDKSVLSGQKAVDSSDQNEDAQNNNVPNNNETVNNEDVENEDDDDFAENGTGIPELDRVEFQSETLILMLRVLVGEKDFENAEKIISHLEKLYQKEGLADSEKLIRVYIQLGVQLEERLKQLGELAKKNPEKRKEMTEVAKGFEEFLNRILKRGVQNNYNTLRWIADTFYRLASGLSGSSITPPSDAVAYYKRAGSAYNAILKQLEKNPDWGPVDAKILITVRTSECLRAMQMFDQAIKGLLVLIKENPNHLELQIEGAKVYQARGRIDKDFYVKAVVGGEPDEKGKNLIWGWNQIAVRTAKLIQTNPRFKDIFYDANYNKIYCRYSLARLSSDPASIDKHLKATENDLLRLQQLYPDLGGSEWFGKFNAFLIRVRKLLGEQNPSGFKQTLRR